MPKKNPKLSDEENRAKYREYQARYRAKKAEQQRQAGNDTPKSKPAAKALETLTESDPATTAAIINQRYEYSKIIAYHKFKNKVTICEHMKLYEDSQPFRVKVTTYESFSTKADAVAWMKSHGCKKLDLF